MLFISQSYLRLQRQTVKENRNFVFFLLDKKILNHIYTDHCVSDNITLTITLKFCSNVWSENKHTTDLTRPGNCGNYRKKLKKF